jgi:quinol monooxygenase YgiN
MNKFNSTSLFVVLVDFVVQQEHSDAFARLVIENAEASRTREDGCIQFDVCRPSEGNRFFLYELYGNAAAFDAHLGTAHFKSFDAKVAPWIVEKRVRS